MFIVGVKLAILYDNCFFILLQQPRRKSRLNSLVAWFPTKVLLKLTSTTTGVPSVMTSLEMKKLP